jgi:hypothetical protein
MRSQEIEQIVNDIRYKISNNKKIDDKDYIEFKNKYENLYKMCMQKNFDSNQFNYFLHKLKQIEEKKITEYDASVSIGTLLVDKYVKPQLN